MLIPGVLSGVFFVHAATVDRTVYVSEDMILLPAAVSSDSWQNPEKSVSQELNDFSLYQDFSSSNSATLSAQQPVVSPESQSITMPTDGSQDAATPSTDGQTESEPLEIQLPTEQTPTEEPVSEVIEEPVVEELPEPESEPIPEVLSQINISDLLLYRVFARRADSFPFAQGVITEEVPAEVSTVEDSPENIVTEKSESETSLDVPTDPAIETEEIESLNTPELEESPEAVEIESAEESEDTYVNQPSATEECSAQLNCQTYSVNYSDFAIPEFESGTVLDSAQIRMSLGARTKSLQDGDIQRFLVEYSYDQGATWSIASLMDIESELSNSINGGFFLVTLPKPPSPRELSNLALRVSYQGNIEKLDNAFIEAVWLEITSGTFYEEGDIVPAADTLDYSRDLEIPKFHTLNNVGTDVAMNALPSFTLSYDPQQNFFRRMFTALFSENTYAVEAVRLIDREGKIIEVPTKVVYEEDKTWTVQFEKQPQKLVPGKYQLEVVVNENDTLFVDSFEFYWGVLAVNTKKSMYFPNQEVVLNLAALTNKGDTICDAVLELKIIDPKNNIFEVPVEQSESCGANNVTDIPDYLATFTDTGEWGAYTVQLVHKNTAGEVIHRIEDFFEVREYIPYDIERTAPTRIYPPAPYTVTLDITANRSFVGDIVERVPRGFVFADTSGAEVTTLEEATLLTWKDVTLEEGQKISLSYIFDAPDISPYMYLLGPLDMDGFKELRQWQIASDAISSVAWLGATQSELGTNLNDATPAALLWSSSTVDSFYFTHSTSTTPERLFVDKAGDYLVSVTLPIQRFDANDARSRVGFEVRVNGTVVPEGLGRSGFIKNQLNTNRQNNSSSHGSFLLTNLSPEDYIEVYVQALATSVANPITILGQASMYVEHIAPLTGVFAAVSTSTTNSVNLNQVTAYPLSWTETRQDTGFVHSDTVNPNEIRISDPGAYMVFINVPIQSPAVNGNRNVLGRVLLDGVQVSGGVMAQGYHAASADDDLDASIHWSGIVVSTTTNQVLTITTEREGNAGTTTVPTGFEGSIYIQELPTDDVIALRGRDLSGGTNWNVTPAQSVLFDSQLAYDNVVFTHSTSINNDEITINEGGDYLLVYNDALVNTVGNNNVNVDVLVDGIKVSGAQTKTHYVSGGNGNFDSSGSLTFNLESISPGSIVSISVERDANTTTVNDSTDALLMLWKKKELNFRPEAPSMYDTPFDNIRFASTTPRFDFSTTDPDGASSLVYEFSISTTSDFSTAVTRFSDIDSGFSNTASTSDTSPFAEGNRIKYQLQGADALQNNTTYYWRVRAKDVTGSDEYGDWSTTQSLTIDTTMNVADWYQTEDAQFLSNSLTGVASAVGGGAVVDIQENTEVLGIYSELGDTLLRYRFWNGSAWGTEVNGPDMGGTINWTELSAGTQRDEYVAAVLSNDGDVNTLVYSASSSIWGSQNEFVTDVNTPSRRGVTVTHETLSGDAMVIACSAGADPVYTIWNGTSWSATTSIDVAATNNCNWLTVAADPTSDELIMVIKGAADNYEALVWNGSTWGSSVIVGRVGGTNTLAEGMSVEYEESGEQAIVVTADGNDNEFRYTAWNGADWSTVFTVPISVSVDEFENGNLVRDDGSDQVGFCLVDSQNDIDAFIWDGDSWGLETQLEPATLGQQSRTFDCEFESVPGRDGNFLVAYTDAANDEYQYYDTAWSGPQAMSNIEDSYYVQTVKAGDGTIIAWAYENVATDRIVSASFNGTSWSNSSIIEATPPTTIAAPRSELFAMAAKRFTFAQGVLVTHPIDFSFVASQPTWGDLSFTTTEPVGTSVTVRVKYSNAGTCDSYIPGAALPGNDTGFTSVDVPINLSGVSTTTYDQICLEATIERTGGVSATLNDWNVTWVRQPKLVQNEFRWFANGSFLTPTDPWPLGIFDIGLNEPLTANESVSIDETIRLRMSLQGLNIDTPALSETFKLQYAAGLTCSADLDWFDVGGPASTTAIWRGYENAVVGDDWYDGAWNRRLKITVDNTLVDADLTNFPVYVNLDDLPATFFDNVQSDGDDIRITTNDGLTELPYELVSINTTTDKGELHFKASLASLTDTEFYIYYGNGAASAYGVTATYGRNNVWSNSFKAVYHLETSPASTLTDSTGNGRTLTSSGGMGAGNSVTAAIGNGIDFDGINDRLTNAAWAWTDNPVTVTAWNNVATAEVQSSNLFGFTFGAPNERFASHAPWSDNTIYWDYGSCCGSPGRVSTSYTTFRNKWTHVGLVSQGGGGTFMGIYLDGTLRNSLATADDPSVTLTGFSLGSDNPAGGNHHNGRVDEFRIASVARTATWLSTEENNQSNATGFYDISAEELIGDGSTLPSTKLASSTYPETYEEQNPTRQNQNLIVVGENAEWDFVLQNNAGAADTNYCFRMVYEDGGVLSTYDRYPRLITNAPPLATDLLAPFDNEQTASTSPWFEFAASDELDDLVSYEVEIDADYDFSSPDIVRESNASFSQFTNLSDPSQRGLYTPGQIIQFIPNTALSNGVTYWWRVRARDDEGSGALGEWSNPKSFTVDTATVITTWHQTTEEQFDTNDLVNADANAVDDVRIATGFTVATTTGTAIDFDDRDSGNAWGELQFVDNETSGDIKYAIEYLVSGNEWALIPDIDLAGNAAGFDVTGVSLANLNTTTYNNIRIRAVLTGNSSLPRILSWSILWGERIEPPVHITPFDNAKVSSLTPTLQFAATDPQGDVMEYEVEVSQTADFNTSTVYVSGLDTGFSNVTTPADTTPFNSTETIEYDFQSVLVNDVTYWWRVRARDINNENAYSDWSSGESFTVEVGLGVSTWYQTTGDQFSTNENRNIEPNATQAQISSTITEAMVAYGESTSLSPQYRIWSGTEWGDAQSALNTGGFVEWSELKAATKRSEYALGTLGTDGDVNVQIYNGNTGTWGNMSELVTEILNTGLRAMDVAYETSSGELLAVACSDDDAVYRLWDGTSWTATSSIALTKATDCQYIKLVSDPSSNEIISVFKHESTGANDYEVLVWNGTSWGSSLTFGEMTENANEGIAVEYEASGDQAVVVVSNGDTAGFRYNTWNGSSWSGSITNALQDDFEHGILKRDVGTDRLALCAIDQDGQISTTFWDGAAWGAYTTIDTLGNSQQGRPVSCEFETSGSRDGYLMIPYSDTVNARYQFASSTYSGELNISGLNLNVGAWTTQSIRTADGLILSIFLKDGSVAPADQYLFSYWDGTAWLSQQSLSDVPSVSGTPFHESIAMAAQIFPNFTDGTILSTPIDFADGGSPRWQEISWNDTKPAASTVDYRVYFESATGTFSLIPDSALPGNAAGLTVSPVDISDLDPTIYSVIKLEAELVCDDADCPSLQDWTVQWSEGITISGLAFEYDQSTVLASGTIAVAVNGVLQVGKTADITGLVGAQEAVYTTTGTSTFTVPAGVSEVTVKAWGAGGGSGAGGIRNAGAVGGGAGFVQGDLAVTPAENLTVYVGGGGAGGQFGIPAGGGAGGGYSGLYRTTTALLIAGGGGGGGAGAGGIGFVGVGTACAVTATSCSPNIPQGTSEDDVLVLVLKSRTNTAHTCSVNCTGWTEFSTQAGDANGRLSVWYYRQGSTTPAIPTFAGPATDTYTGRIWAFRGVEDTGNPFDQVSANTAQAATTNYSGSNLTSTVSNSMLIYVGGAADNTTWGPSGGSCNVPSGVNTDFYTDNANGNDNSIFLCYDSTPSNNTGSLGVPTMTQSLSTAGRWFGFNLRPETGTPLPAAGVGGVGGGLLGGDGGSSDSSFSATGGATSDLFGFRHHVFTADGTFEIVSGSRSIDLLLLGGGGGGGGYRYGGGGGGAGGLRVLEGQTFGVDTYAVTIGGGGAGGDNTDTSTGNGQTGSNSSFDTEVALGGGGGLRGDRPNDSSTGISGGSGGGGGSTNVNAVSHAGGTGTAGQGNNAGAGSNANATNDQSGGGGGGASAVGNAGSVTTGGTGGAGLNQSYLWGTSVGVSGLFGGGGGGGKRNTETAGVGGAGGGAAGGVGNNNGVTAAVNTGGGGGGGGGTTATQFGGGGGSGVVIARYRIPLLGGLGGTQSAGGAAQSAGATAGSAFLGGAGESGLNGGAGGTGGVLGGAAGGTGNSNTAEAGGGGGAAGYFGGGGGARGNAALFSGSGGAGGSSYVAPGISATNTQNGSGLLAANNSDSKYASGAGMGGTAGATSVNGSVGGDGRVVISWTGSTTAGTFTIPNVSVSAGDIVTLFIVGADGSKEAVSVTKYDGTGDISGMQLSERHLTLGSDDAPTVTNADIEVYKNSDNEDVFLDVTGGTTMNICAETTCADARLRILAGTTYRPAGNGSIVNLQNNGTLSPEGNTLRVRGDWGQYGTFNTGASTIIFTATSSTQTLANSTSTYIFNNVTFGETSGSATWNITKPLVVSGALVVNYGTLARATSLIVASGNFTIGSSGYLSGLGTTTFAGAGSSVWGDAKAISSGSNFGYVVVDGTAKTIALSGNVTTQTVTIGTDDTLNASGSGYNINVYRTWTNNNSFIPQTGTVTLVGTTTGTIARGASSFNNLTFAGVGSNWSFSAPTLALNGNFTIATGTVTMPTGTTTIAGSFANTGGVFQHNNGEVRMTSTSGGRTITQKATPFLNAFYDLVFTGTGAWSFSESAATTTRNFRMTAGTVTFPSGTLTVGGDFLTTGTGAFAHNSGEVVLLVQGNNSASTRTSSLNNLRTFGAGGSWYNSNWSRRVSVTVDKNDVASSLTDFPVYVNLANLPSAFFSGVQSDGDDIRITTSNGATELPFELVSINTTLKTGELHFKASLSSTTDTQFYIYYGNAGTAGYAVTDTYGRNNVWTNGYEAVYHLGTSPASTMTDSTSNGRNLTSQGGMGAGNSVAGMLGNSVDFDGSNDYLRNTTFAWTANPVTITAWNNVAVSETQISNMFGFVASGNERNAVHAPYSDAILYWDYGTCCVSPGRITTSYASYRDKWTHVGLVSQGGAGAFMGIYLDGALVSSVTSSDDPNVTLTGFGIGAQGSAGGGHHNGRIDEFRVASVARTTGWIATERSNQASTTNFYTVSGEEQKFTRTFTDTNVTVLGNVTLDVGGTAVFPTGILSIAGSFDNNATFNANGGTVRFNSTTGSKTIAAGASSFATVDFNSASGNFTVTENATATVAFNLSSAAAFTLQSGRVFESTGTFSNAATASSTTWTGSTLRLSGADHTINTKVSQGDTYATLLAVNDTDIAMWNSTATVYSTPNTASIYSQDHAGVDGDLTIYGNYVRTTGTEFWSYATDFDGVALGVSGRQVDVRFAPSAIIGLSNASLNLVGASAASTTLDAVSGTYSLSATNTTITAEHFRVAGTGVSGLGLKASTTLSTFKDGFFTVAPSRSGITIDATTVAKNASAQFSRIGFATTTPGAASNVTLSGTTASFVWFREGPGGLYGEAYDNVDGNPGSIRFDDSSNNIVVSGTVYADDGTTTLGGPTCDGITQNVRVVVNGGTYTATTACSGINGSYSFPSVAYIGDPKIVVYLNTNGGVQGSVVTKTPSGNITNMNIYANRVITRHQDVAPLTIADMQSYDFTDDTDLRFIASSTNLTVLPNSGLYVFASTTFTPGGNISLTGNANTNGYEGTLQIGSGATFTAVGTQTHTLAGRFVKATSGTFNAASSTFVFTASTTGKSITSANTLTFNEIEFTGSGDWYITAPLVVQGNMDVNAGTVTGTSNITLNYGSLSGNGLLSLGSGTTTIARTNTFGGNTPWTVANLVLGNGSNIGTTSLASSATTTVLGRLTIAAAHFLDGASSQWDLAGTGTVFVETGTFLQDATHVRYSGAGAIVKNTSYYNLEVNAAVGSPTYTAAALGIIVENNLLVGGDSATNFTLDTNNSALQVLGLVDIKTTGTLVADGSATFEVLGDWNNDGAFTSNGGTVRFTGATGTTIAAGNSSFASVIINNGAGTFTVTENATSTNAWTLTNHSAFTVNSGTVLAVGGQFTNTLGDTTTSWTGSTLKLFGTLTQTINASTTKDSYETLVVTTNAQVRMWNSQATTYVTTAGGGLYSQDHAEVIGDLNIYGAVVVTSGTDYWSYATDFDGTNLTGGDERAPAISFASGASAKWQGGSLSALGTTTASTTIANQGSGTYSLTFAGTAIVDFEHVTFRNLDGNGVIFTGVPTVNNFSAVDIEVASNGGTTMTVGGAVIDANPAKNFSQNIFAAAGGVTGASNVTATGTSVSSWRFTNYQGNLGGETYDVDPDGDPGYLVWDDSAALITVSGNVYSDEGSTVSTVCDGSTNNVVLRVAGLTTYSTSCNAGTGAYSLGGVAFSPLDTLTLYIDGETQKATTVTADPISSISSLHLYENRVIVRHENTNPMTISKMAVWDSSDDADIIFTAVDSSPDTLSLGADTKLVIWNNKTFTPGGNITLLGGGAGAAYDGTLEAYSGARFTAAGTESHSVGGSFIFGSSAVFTAAQSTITFTTSGSSRTIDTNAGSFYGASFTGSGSWSITDPTLTVRQTLAQSNGTLTFPTGTTTVGASFNATGGSFTINGSSLLFTSTSTGNSVRTDNSALAAVTFRGTGGAWTFNDTNATTTGSFLVASGTVTLPSNILKVGGDFENRGGTVVHNTSDIYLTNATAARVTPRTSDLFALRFVGGGTYTFGTANFTLLDDLELSSGALSLATGTMAIGGSFIGTGGAITHASGTVLFNSADTGETINFGNNPMHAVVIGSATGGWTWLSHATTTGNFSLTAANTFIKESGTILTVEGVFLNTVGGAATTWTNTRIKLLTGADYTVNTKISGADFYGTLQVGADTNIRTWNSSAATTTVTSVSSLYSQDHNATDGNLNIYGNFNIATSSEYWSYATDFDGAALSGLSRRAVSVKFAQNSTTTLESGSLSIVGASGASTTVASLSGVYSMSLEGGTFTAQHHRWDDLDSNGLNFSGVPTISDISDGYFELASDTGSLITVASSTLNANASKQLNRLAFNAVGPLSGFNIELIGETTNAWQINDSLGNIGGEGFDIDGIDACGAIRFDDSDCLLLAQTQVRWRNDNGSEAAPGEEWFNTNFDYRQRVRIENDTNTAYASTAVKIIVPYDSDMQSNFEDLRFTADDGFTPVPFWIEREIASTEAQVWVRVPTLPAEDIATVFMYYGNGLVTSSSSGATTFEVIDDFEDNSMSEYSGGNIGLFTTGTTPVFGGTYALKASNVNGRTSGGGIYNTGVSVAQGEIIRYRQYIDTTAGSDNEACTLFGIQSPGSSNDNYGVCLELFGTDRISLSRDVIDNDSSGSVLASKNVTYTTGWYEVQVDWQTSDKIDVYLFNPAGTLTATTSATDGTYTSGGIGYSFWFQDGAWDSITSRNRGPITPTVYFGSEQTDGGASWRSAQNVAGGGIPDEVMRLRIGIENSGLAVTNQLFTLEYAARGVAPSCGSVSTGSYTPVPNAASCGSSPLCMETSTFVSDSQTTTDLLFGTSGQFSSGKLIESPSNQTSAISVDQDYYTELEYVLKPTVNASDTYCLRVTNDGTELDFYENIAELSLQFDPVFGAVTLNDGANISLIPGTTTAVYATGTITDFNGYADIVSATSTFYRSGVSGGAACTPDNNNCYVSQCQLTNCTGDTCDVECRADIFFHAEPTDTGSAFDGQEWFAFLEAEDSSSGYDFQTSFGVLLDSMRAIDVNGAINYGTLEVNADTGSTNASTSIINQGNVEVNIDVTGTDLSDGASSYIPASQQKFSTSTFTYSACGGICALVSSTTPVELDVELAKPTSDSPPVEDEVFWGIAIPFGINSAPHQGINVFTPVSP